MNKRDIVLSRRRTFQRFIIGEGIVRAIKFSPITTTRDLVGSR